MRENTSNCIFYGLISAVMILLLPAKATATELKVAGSTTVQKRILEPTMELIKKDLAMDIKIDGNGSGNGFKDLMDGKIKVSIASSPLEILLKKRKLKNDGTYIQHTIYEDVIIPIVHPSNTVSQLSWQQLADIHTGKITNWKEVGGPDKKIFVITSHPNAATRLVFQKQVMKGKAYVKGAKEVHTTRVELDYVSKYSGCIGAVSMGFIKIYHAKVKTIQTDRIARPLCFITKGAPTPEVQKLLDYLRKPEIQKKFK